MLQKKTTQTYQNSEALFYQNLIEESSSAFNYLYLETYKLCIPYALSKGSNQEEAEDLLQECLAIFIDKLRDRTYIFQDETKITTYFYSIYINQCKKTFEQKTKRAEVRLKISDDIEHEDDDVIKGISTSVISIFNDTEGKKEIVKFNHESVFDNYDEDERTWIFKKLDRSFSLLGEDCRNVLQWFYVDDWSLKRIAEALKMTEASATVKRFKCAKYLKEKFRLV